MSWLEIVPEIDAGVGAATGEEDRQKDEAAQRHEGAQVAPPAEKREPATAGQRWVCSGRRPTRISLPPSRAVENLAPSIQQAFENESTLNVSVELNLSLQSPFEKSDPFLRFGAHG